MELSSLSSFEMDEFNNNNNINNIKNIKKKPKSIIKLSILSLLFGIGSWITITGLWLELPFLIQKLPEKLTLASKLNLMIQLANIGPLLYWLLMKIFSKQFINDITITHLQMLLGLLSSIILIFNWNKTISFNNNNNNNEYSIYLLILTFFLSLVDCTSSITFLQFMSRFHIKFMTPYLIGEGLSGLIPLIFALFQGINQFNNDNDNDNVNIDIGNDELENQSIIFQNNNINDSSIINSEIINLNEKQNWIKPKFSIEIFFSSLSLTLFISYLAFIALQFLSFSKSERKRMKRLRHYNNNNKNKLPKRQMEIKFQINYKCYIYLLFLMFWNCFTTFGFMPSLQPYSSIPYSYNTLNFVVIISSISYPIGCFWAMLIEKRSIKLITILTFISTLFCSYIIIASVFYPKPFLFTNNHLKQTYGSWLMILIWALFVIISSYTKTIITIIICDYNHIKGMFWVGMQTQFGSAIGAFLSFILINYTNLFNK